MLALYEKLKSYTTLFLRKENHLMCTSLKKSITSF